MYEGVELKLTSSVRRLWLPLKIMTVAIFVAASLGQPIFSQSPGDFDAISATHPAPNAAA